MDMKRLVYRGINRCLAVAGLRLAAIERDFEARTLDESVQDMLFRDLARTMGGYLETQRLFTPIPFDIEAAVRDFYFRYLDSPYRDQFGGSRFNNCLWLYLIARSFDPGRVIDSGAYRGASAWAFALGAPDAEILSFDIDLSHLSHRAPGVRYLQSDWTEFDLGTGVRTLCYFDDHVDQARRLLESHARGIELAIFDDDFPVVPALAMSHDGGAFPKIEFVLDEALRNQAALRWSRSGRVFEWPVDATYLDRARAAIAATERLPDTSRFTGIQQTPYRIVKLRQPA
jgi:hypothetical protein